MCQNKFYYLWLQTKEGLITGFYIGYPTISILKGLTTIVAVVIIDRGIKVTLGMLMFWGIKLQMVNGRSTKVELIISYPLLIPRNNKVLKTRNKVLIIVE